MRISKYIQHSLLCVIRSQMCPVLIGLLVMDIVPRAFSTCKISTYRVRKSSKRVSEYMSELVNE